MTTAAFEATGSPPIPEPNELTRFYWDAVDEHRLELLRCQNCGHYIHYPQPVCNRCGSADLSSRGGLRSRFAVQLLRGVAGVASVLPPTSCRTSSG